jgi:predicted aldo/keto reductase-like oxidoreductase
VEFWSFHEVIYDNDPEWISDHGGLDAAQEARDQGRVRWIAFHGEKSPHIALKLLARGFAWDVALMPLNPFDASFRSFEKQVLPEVIRRGAAVIGTKPMAGGAIPANKVIKPEDALRYAWSLPVASVLVGLRFERTILKKTLKSASGLQGVPRRRDGCAAAEGTPDRGRLGATSATRRRRSSTARPGRRARVSR